MLNGFQKFVIGELAQPIMRRIGTAAGGYLVGVGVATEVANTIVLGLIAAMGVGIDLINSSAERKIRK
jgi:hypothetical protein